MHGHWASYQRPAGQANLTPNRHLRYSPPPAAKHLTTHPITDNPALQLTALSFNVLLLILVE